MCNLWLKFHHDIQPDNNFILFKQLDPVLCINENKVETEKYVSPESWQLKS